MNHIDYSDLAKAQKSYRDLGYTYIETPWWVTEEIMNITKPEGASSYKLSINDKCLVASGEQSLLYMINKGQLPLGLWQTITPCYRNEAFDAYHSKYFMKLELMHLISRGYSIDSYNDLVKRVATDALRTIGSMIQPYGELKLVVTNQSVFDKTIIPGTETVDLVAIVDDEEIELGSYGARNCSVATWIYGTGIAVPRFSKVRDRLMFLREMR
jgi:hypothetical protein